MSSQPLTFESFPELHDHAEPQGEDVHGPIRGIAMGIVLCAPFWAGVYWLVRSLL